MSRRFGDFQQGTGRFPVGSGTATLSGTSWVQLIPAPPKKVAFRVSHIWGQNTAGAARILEIAFNDDGNRTVVWRSSSTASGDCFTQASAGAEVFDFGMILHGSDESLDIRLDDTGTDVIVAGWDVVDGDGEK